MVLVLFIEKFRLMVDNWGSVFKNGSSKISGRHPLKSLKGDGLSDAIF